MDPFDLFSDDDMFITMMYEYYTNKLQEENESTLQTRSSRLNKNCAKAHKRLYQNYG